MKPIIVVSGLPRSGTSMMMQMLEAGGVEIYTDNLRQADEDNPKGYYELERVKQLDKGKDKSWVGEATGKAVKIISQLLKELPPAHTYQVVFMNRELNEVLASQHKMLIRRGTAGEGNNNDENLRRLFRMHLDDVKDWLARQSNFQVIEIDYAKVVQDPASQALRLREFLGIDLNVEQMATIADKSLYRNRR